MTTTTYLPHLLSSDDIDSIVNYNATVIETTRQQLLSMTVGELSLSLRLPDHVRAILETAWSITLPTEIPSRWIRGDMPMHVDVSSDPRFLRTHLMYVIEPQGGQLVIHEKSFPIHAGDAFIFDRGQQHGTVNCPYDRLILGPCSEHGISVGYSPGVYYTNVDGTTQYNSTVLNGTFLSITTLNDDYGTTFTPPTGEVQTGWQYVQGNSYGYANFTIDGINGNDIADGQIFPIGTSYTTMNGINASGICVYPVYGTLVCFRKGTYIQLADHSYRRIENLRLGDRVRTYGPISDRPIAKILHSKCENPAHALRDKNRLFRLTSVDYPELWEDLHITGSHAILVDKITMSQGKQLIQTFGDIFVTDDKIRLMACIDDRAEPFTEQGTFSIYHLALEDPDPFRNFGIYANGLLVESTFLAPDYGR